MDISLENEEYCSLKRSYDTALEECVEAELSLPEYMPEILRIIKSVAVPKINSYTTVGERVTIDGVCELRMIYVGEDNCIYTFSQSRNFTRYCENSAFSDACDVKVKANVNFVNCRATNTKRAEIKAGLGLFVTAFSENREPIIFLSDSQSIEEQKTDVSCMSLGCKKSKMFSMSDTFELENDNALFLVNTCASAVLGEVRKISNKLMLKGDVIVDISYVSGEERETIKHLRKFLPINQILEFDGMEEHYTGDVCLEVLALDVMIINDSSGNGKTFDVALSVNTSITMWEPKELSPMTDAYAIDGTVDLTYKKIKFYNALDAVRDTYNFKGLIDVSKIAPENVLDSFYELGEPDTKYSDGILEIIGTLKVSLILKDTSGSVVTTEKILDYKYERKLDTEKQKTECTPSVTISSFETQLRGKDEVNVKAEMQINCSVFGETEINVVSDIKEGIEKEKLSKSAITVYFPKTKETLWEIAKRYNTTVESILLENNLESETTENVKMLFIPTT